MKNVFAALYFFAVTLSTAHGFELKDIEVIAPNNADSSFTQGLDGDGNSVVSSAPTAGSGRVYAYEFDSGQLNFNQAITAPSSISDPSLNHLSRFGNEIEISGEWLAVSAPNATSNGNRAGAVYLYQKQMGSWVFTQALVPVNSAGLPNGENFQFFGQSISMSSDASVLAVASPGWGPVPSVWVYRRNGSLWTLEDRINANGTIGENWGKRVEIEGDDLAIIDPTSAFNLNGTTNVVSASGLIILCKYNGVGQWPISNILVPQSSQVFPILPETIGMNFGSQAEFSNDKLIVSAPGYDSDSGQILIWDRNNQGGFSGAANQIIDAAGVLGNQVVRDLGASLDAKGDWLIFTAKKGLKSFVFRYKFDGSQYIENGVMSSDTNNSTVKTFFHNEFVALGNSEIATGVSHLQLFFNPVDSSSAFCSHTTANSTGQQAQLSAHGVSLGTNYYIKLKGQNLPPNSNFVALYSSVVNPSGVSAGNGKYCLGGSTTTWYGDAGSSDSTGNVNVDLPFNLIAFLTGQNVHLQLIYRDYVTPSAVAGYNLTTGVTIPF